MLIPTMVQSVSKNTVKHIQDKEDNFFRLVLRLSSQIIMYNLGWPPSQ